MKLALDGAKPKLENKYQIIEVKSSKFSFTLELILKIKLINFT